MLKIGDFSKLSRLSVRMLRHYDERGLLVPLSTDPFTGYRYYAEEQLAAAAHIAALRAMGFSLAEGPVFNIYHVSLHETDNPEEFVTEVCYPIRQK